MKHRHRKPKLPMPAVLLTLFRKLLANNSCGRLREDGTDNECRHRSKPRPPSHQPNDSGGKEDLTRSQAKDLMPQRMNLRQRKIQTNRKQEKHNTEFGKCSDLRDVDHRPHCVWPEYQSNKQIAKTAWNIESVECNNHRNSHPQQEQYLREILHQVPPSLIA
ncbi:MULTISPECIES: hypothetical protein [Nitrosomonas]|uniref:hypothetical protein n=1 Tax=Nitrosomonas TaxID=914 RepID=UPI003898D7B4